MPAVVAIAVTPLLIQTFGTANYGVLSLQMAVLVLLGVNDFGISRAIILVAVSEGGFRDAVRRTATAQAGLHLTVTLAVAVLVAGASVVLLGPAIWSATNDRTLSWLLTVVSAALSLATLPFRASMEVEERFVALNFWRTLATSLLFIAPLLAVLVVSSLTAAATGLLISRVVVLIGFFGISRVQPLGQLIGSYAGFVANLRRRQLTDLHWTLIRRGFWLGVGGLVSMLIGYSDRFVLGALGRATDVAHYVVASELATKLWLVVGALSIAATPRLSAAWSEGDRDHFDVFFAWFAGAIAAIALLSHIVLIGLSDRLLYLWLGAAYAPVIGEVVKILSIGISLNCLSQANFTLLNVARRERSGATVQVVMLPLTVLGLVIAVHYGGPIGAAWTFTIRLAIDSAVIRGIVHRKVGERGRHGVAAWHQAVFGLVLVGIYAVGSLH